MDAVLYRNGSEKSTLDGTHPVGESEDRKTVERGEIILFALASLAGIASAIYWLL